MSAMTTDATTASARRPLKTRDARWAKVLSERLARAGASPNGISVVSVVVACGAGTAFWRAGQTTTSAEACALFVLGGVLIQTRLLCNMLDGMVALESGRRSPVGEIYNDLPDRLADVFIIVGAGYATALPWGVTVGWVAATLAVLTAYVRLLGRALGTPSFFIGPMAKPHRMAALTAASAVAAVAVWWGYAGRVIAVALAVIAVGAAWTCVRRLARICAALRQGAV